MSKRIRLYFYAVQIIGSLIGLGAHHVDQVSWVVSTVMLLPGILLSFQFYLPGRIGNIWPKWSIFAIAVIANLIIFELIGVGINIWHKSKAQAVKNE